MTSKMLPTGRGAIAHVEYTGEEAAPEIRKLLSAVVISMLRIALGDTDNVKGRKRRRIRSMGSNGHSRF